VEAFSRTPAADTKNIRKTMVRQLAEASREPQSQTNLEDYNRWTCVPSGPARNIDFAAHDLEEHRLAIRI